MYLFVSICMYVRNLYIELTHTKILTFSETSARPPNIDAIPTHWKMDM